MSIYLDIYLDIYIYLYITYLSMSIYLSTSII